MDRPKVLIVDDEPSIVEAVSIALEDEYVVLGAHSGNEGLDVLARHPEVAVILSDQRMPGMNGAEFLERTIERSPRAVRIILTGYTDIESLVEAINAGKVYHYLTKPWQPSELRLILRRAIEYHQLQHERSQLHSDLALRNRELEAALGRLKEAQAQLLESQRREYERTLEEKEREISLLHRNLSERYRFGAIIGRSTAMQKIYRLIETVAASDATVMIQGESGTGKELVAKAIHFNGARREEGFVAQNCAALPETLLESELFGYVKGAFTGAIRDKRGLFEVASRGTLFLDEVSEMSPALQVKLLRVLQDGSYIRVGDDAARTTQARIVSASNRDLYTLARQGKFREDLYYRLHVVRITLPPLRDRREDIPLLVEHFLSNAGDGRPAVEASLFELFDRHDWPGNVRELEHEIKRMLTLHPGVRRLTAEMASDAVRKRPVGRARIARGTTLKATTEEIEREVIREGLERTRGNKTKLARELGLSRKGLLDKMARYKISAPRRTPAGVRS